MQFNTILRKGCNVVIAYREEGLRQAHLVQQLAVEIGFGVMLATLWTSTPCGADSFEVFCFCLRISSSR